VNEEWGILAAEGTASNGDAWMLRYRPEGEGGRHHLTLYVNGGERESGSGFDMPEVTEIGFGGGLTAGHGHYYLYGIVTSRIHVVRAESHDVTCWSEVVTEAVPGATDGDGVALRVFVLVRPPVEDVSALVGVNRAGEVVQRIPLSVGPG
jgi:hypothetical protein